MANLVTLNLQGNSISDIGGLEALVNLQWLSLAGNSIVVSSLQLGDTQFSLSSMLPLFLHPPSFLSLSPLFFLLLFFPSILILLPPSLLPHHHSLPPSFLWLPSFLPFVNIPHSSLSVLPLSFLPPTPHPSKSLLSTRAWRGSILVSN